MEVLVSKQFAVFISFQPHQIQQKTVYKAVKFSVRFLVFETINVHNNEHFY